jgi:hypothetical protein
MTETTQSRPVACKRDGGVRAALAVCLLAAVATVCHTPAALAQASPPIVTPGDPLRTIPERIEPPASNTPDTPLAVPKAPPGSLSDQLSRGDGVIEPPKGVDPEMSVRPPASDGGRMPVIPPPGTPGHPSPVRPK